MIFIIAQLLGVDPYNWNDNHDNVKILSMQDTEDIDTPAMIVL